MEAPTRAPIVVACLLVLAGIYWGVRGLRVPQPTPALTEASHLIDARVYVNLPTGDVFFLLAGRQVCYITVDEYLQVALGEPHTCLWRDAR